MKHLTLLILLLFGSALTVGSPLFAQADEDQGDDEEEYVTMEEFQQALDELRQLKTQADVNRPGTTGFLLTGYATSTYSDSGTADSNFLATFNPIFLWKLNDRMLLESEVEFELEGSGTEVNLEYAQMLYLLTDNITLGAGKFLSPFGLFRERIHPAWINKLPDFPMVVRGKTRLVPGTVTGAEVRGAVPINEAKVTYVVWVGNGGALINDDPMLVGAFRFNNFEDVDNNKHVGTRIGVIPIPGVEVGASVLKGSVSGAKTSSLDVGTTVWGVDFTLNQEVKPLGGRVRVDAELIKSNVETVTFLKKGIGPLRFNNDRSGGYTQLAYRPTLADSTLVSNTEAVFRYDWQNFPIGAPMNMDLGRATFGLDYWVSPATVLKIAVDRLFVQGGQNVMSFYFQIAMGV